MKDGIHPHYRPGSSVTAPPGAWTAATVAKGDRSPPECARGARA